MAVQYSRQPLVSNLRTASKSGTLTRVFFTWIPSPLRNTPSMGLLLLLLGLLVPLMIAACGGGDPTAAPQAAAQPSPEPTVRSQTATPGPKSSTDDAVRMSALGSLGGRLTDSNGITLYIFTEDGRNVSNCSDRCTDVWPPMLVDGNPFASRGVNADWLTTIERDDGSTQAIYNGMPLYRFSGDENPGDANGQGKGDVWFVVSGRGHPLFTSAIVNAADRWVASKIGGGNDTQHGEFSTILIDATGRSLYLFTDDGPKVSNCTGGCAVAWPPLTTVEDPTAGEGISADRLGTTDREDGSKQVTFDGNPLYYYSNDKKSGDSLGQDTDGAWFVINNSDPLIIPLNEQNASGQTGTAVITGRANFINIAVTLSEGALETEQAHIHEGQCVPGDLGAVAHALISFEGGSGISVTNVPIPLDSLIAGGFAVNTHKAGEASVYTSCGNIVAGGN